MKNERLSKIKALMQAKQNPSVRSRPIFWKPMRLIQRITSDKAIQSWLLTKGSLTQRIRQQCPDMQVLVLSEQTERPLLEESIALGLAENEQAWVRCVMLKCADQNWVYARTVIPNLTPNNPWTALQKLGNKPLGEILFETPGLQRSPFELSNQALGDLPYLAAQIKGAARNTKGYARRSRFTQDKAPLLLTEVFLPGLLALDQAGF